MILVNLLKTLSCLDTLMWTLPFKTEHKRYLVAKKYYNLNYLLNENASDILPFNKAKTFIEKKLSAMKLKSFNL